MKSRRGTKSDKGSRRARQDASVPELGEADPLTELILAIGRDAAKHIKDEYRQIDHADLLYDERGLPK